MITSYAEGTARTVISGGRELADQQTFPLAAGDNDNVTPLPTRRISDLGADVRPLPGRNLRIALFSGNYNYVKDGANQALNRLVAYLESQGATVRVYSPTVDKPAFEPAGTLVSVPSIPIPLRPEYRIALGLPKDIERDIDAFSPNIVHISAPDFLGQRAIKYARKRGLPVVASVHTRFENYLRYYHLGWLEGLLQRQIGAIYNRCDEIYVPTTCMQTLLTEAGVHVPMKMWSRGVETTLYGPFRRDMAWRASMGIKADEPVITFVGRLVLEKGLETFASALDLLAARGVCFHTLVAGEGPEREWFEKRMPHAHFLGFQSGEALARAYASSDIFFNPSSTEAFGNVTLEAMASGVPQVCANASGSKFLVQDGVTGFLVEAEDVEGYADRIETLIADRDCHRRFSTASRTRGLSFNWDNILAEVLGHYQGLLMMNRRAAE